MIGLQINRQNGILKAATGILAEVGAQTPTEETSGRKTDCRYCWSMLKHPIIDQIHHCKQYVTLGQTVGQKRYAVQTDRHRS